MRVGGRTRRREEDGGEDGSGREEDGSGREEGVE